MDQELSLTWPIKLPEFNGRSWTRNQSGFLGSWIMVQTFIEGQVLAML